MFGYHSPGGCEEPQDLEHSEMDAGSDLMAKVISDTPTVQNTIEI
jgi:hypothetical protein